MLCYQVGLLVTETCGKVSK